MHSLKRYGLAFFSLIIVLTILFSLANKGTIKNEVLIGSLLTLITLFLSFINYLQTSDRFFKELFTEFNARYDQLNNFLNQIHPEQPLTPEEKQKVIDYLNLCAEEYMWVKKGRIPQTIWISWRNGIKTNLEKQSIKVVFEEERQFWKSSYYGFFEDLERAGFIRRD